MKFANKRYRGFTLIELLVVISIIGVAATLSWASVSNAKKQTLVDNACDGVAVMANKARAYALAGMNNANRIRVHCTASSCQIQSSPDASGSNWPTDIESAFVLQSAQFSVAPDITYVIPYATGSGVDATYTIQLVGDASVTKTLSTNNFKAVCQ